VLRVMSLLLLAFIAIVGCTSGAGKRTTPYIIAENALWPSLNLCGKENNVSGFSDDLLLEISRVEGISMQVVSTGQTPVTSLLDKEGIDAVLAGLIMSDPNMREYDVSLPYFTAGPVLVIRKNDPYTALDQMRAKDIGFERGNFWALQLANTADAVFVPYDDISHAFDDLQKGSLDGVVVDAVIGYQLVGGIYKDVMKIAGPPLVPMALRLVVEKGKNEELIQHFNHGLEVLKKNGLYTKMLHYWGLFDANDPSTAFYEGQPDY